MPRLPMTRGFPNLPADTEPFVAATAWASRGYPVFPAAASGKEPLTVHGFKDATTDFDQIERWWRRFPDAAIGVPNCEQFVVLDVDEKLGKHGTDSLRRMEGRHGFLPATVTARTPSGGRHFYMALPDRPVRFAPSGIDARYPHVEIPVYVQVPPTVRPGVGEYRWVSPVGIGLAPFPEWLLSMLDRPARPRPRVRDLCRIASSTTPRLGYGWPTGSVSTPTPARIRRSAPGTATPDRHCTCIRSASTAALAVGGRGSGVERRSTSISAAR
jgi:Bifunctional DNA primase/polymerase, N-terminal